MTSIAEIRERQAIDKRRTLSKFDGSIVNQKIDDVDTLLAHLERYGGHESDCATWYDIGYYNKFAQWPSKRKECDCGWDQINEPPGPSK